MSDLADQYQAALDKASEYEMLGSLTVSHRKRVAYRCQAKFHHSIAKELRAKLESLLKRKEMAQG
jgi:hypothetical protein